jgi:probable F420-dependent oxidoreductase
MKFAIGFATVGAGGTAEGLTALGQIAEECGYESIWSVEHVVVPISHASQYPYGESGPPEDMDLPDPLVPLAYLASITETVKLATGVMLPALRHPLVLAKEIATLDVLSEGRVILGIGVGWLREEFEALGIDFDSRGGRTQATVRALRALWADGPTEFESDYFSWKAVASNPKPVQSHLPIIVGGQAKMAAKRAARYGDGFFPATSTPDELAELIEVIRTECELIGRDPNEIEITAGATRVLTAEEIKAYEEVGARRAFMVPMARTADELRSQLTDFAETVMSEIGAEPARAA